jgi:hypothetical protein
MILTSNGCGGAGDARLLLHAWRKTIGRTRNRANCLAERAGVCRDDELAGRLLPARRAGGVTNQGNRVARAERQESESTEGLNASVISRAQRASLQAWMDVSGGPRPQCGIGRDQRVDFAAVQFVPLIAETCERPNRILTKAVPQIFISQQAADDELDGSL